MIKRDIEKRWRDFTGSRCISKAMDVLEERDLVCVLKEVCDIGKPLLGICLGMQLLFERSEELKDCSGLGLLPGKFVS